eukprot:TRINITY_DN18762_c0_g1_i1.p1 TRINITY_DN18762_c0_g1~~TRINITY_DN18762_c0_g1_i1.p1  ORF type:complete len:393 (+),score=91.92 TRINITY_DN18762_c0_g1_i1:2-1180(+)
MEEAARPVVVVEEVCDDEEHKGIELVSIYATRVEPRHAHALLTLACKHFPLDELHHLKRIKKVVRSEQPPAESVACASSEAAQPNNGPVKAGLYLILCTREQWDSQRLREPEQQSGTAAEPAQPKPLIDLRGSVFEPFAAVLDPFVTAVPKFAPATKEQLSVYNEYWTCAFRDRGKPATTFTADDLQAVSTYMAAALEQASIGVSHGQKANGAVIVNPKTGCIVSRGFDHTTEPPLLQCPFSVHPLHHAAIACINEVARLQLASQPVNEGQGADQCELLHGHKHGHVRGLDCEDDSEEESEEDAGEYLCTGYDLYAVQEPCVMCAMAMVHSRIRRVFYVCADAVMGGLGSVVKLHLRRELNHRFEVFRLVGGSVAVQCSALLVSTANKPPKL